MDTEYRRLAQELKYTNITAHESKESDTFRWHHTGFDRATAAESERICMPLFLERGNSAPKLNSSGQLVVLGYLMTKRFRTLFAQGNDAVVKIDYQLNQDEYRFIFQLKSTDPSIRGWLQITDKKATDIAEVIQNDMPLAWETTPDGFIRIREIDPNATLTVRFNKAE